MDWSILVLVAIVMLVLAGLIWPVLKYGSRKGGHFRAKSLRTIGEIPASGTGVLSVSMKIHQITDSDHDLAVGLEIIAKSPMSYQMLPVSLTAPSARDLVSMLQVVFLSLSMTSMFFICSGAFSPCRLKLF